MLLDTLKYEHCNFRASPFLRQLRSRRRHAPNQQCPERTEPSDSITPVVKRSEVGKFKNLAEHLEDVSKWKCLKTWLPNPVGRAIAQHPLEDEFADMLENLFFGPVVSLPKPVVLTEDVLDCAGIADCDWQVAIEKITGSMWCVCRVVTTCPRRIFDGLASDLQFRVGGWGSSRLLADNLFPHVAEKIACYACK